MHLQKFHYHLLKKDTRQIQSIMTRANEIRRVLDGIELKKTNGEKQAGSNAKQQAVGNKQ